MFAYFSDIDIISDSPINSSDLYLKLVTVTRSPNVIYFEMTKPFDGNGYLYYLATNGKTEEWKNPHVSKIVEVTASSKNQHGYDAISDVVNHDTQGRFHTRHGDENPWITISIINNTSICPTQYCLQSTGPDSHTSFALRNWKLQGSNDGERWTDLFVHVNDQTIKRADGGGVVRGFWDIPIQHRNFYRHFRLNTEGKEQERGRMFGVGGFEIYGFVRKKTILPELQSENKKKCLVA